MRRAHYIAQRKAFVAPKTARVQWQTVLEAAIDVASQAAGRATHDARAAHRGGPAERIRDFPYLLVDIRRLPFPVEGASAALVVEAFFKLSRAFLDAGGDRLRETYAPALEACARALDSLVHDDLCAQAARWKQQIGERE